MASGGREVPLGAGLQLTTGRLAQMVEDQMGTAEEAIAAGAKAPTDRLGKTPRRVTLGIYLDEAVAEDWERATAELQAVTTRQQQEYPRRAALATATARDAETPEADAIAALDAELADERGRLQEQVDKTLAALDDATLWLTFRSLGRAKFRELEARHPASSEDQQAWEEKGQQGKAPYAVESFAKELVEAASFGRVLSRADVVEMAEGENWNDQEWAAVFQAALAAQTAARAVQHRTVPRR